MEKIEKITVERVFNIGNYQTVRFGMEVSTACLNNQECVTDVYNRCLCSVETAFNDIMIERQQQQQQQKNHQQKNF